MSKTPFMDDYKACLEEIGAAIEQLRKESGCSMKPLMATVHMSYRTLKRVYLARN